MRLDTTAVDAPGHLVSSSGAPCCAVLELDSWLVCQQYSWQRNRWIFYGETEEGRGELG